MTDSPYSQELQPLTQSHGEKSTRSITDARPDNSVGGCLFHCTENLGKSALNSFQNTLRGALQWVDKAAGQDLLLPHIHFVDAPQPAEPYSLNWCAQQVGSAIGMAPGFLGVSKLFRCATGAPSFFSPAAVGTPLMAISEGAATGFAFNAALMPSDSKSGNFLYDRAKQGLEGAATFGTLGLSNVGLRAIGTTYLSTGPLRGILTGSVASNLLVGGPLSGWAAAESHAHLFDHRGATRDEVLQSMAGMSIAGATLSTLHQGLSVGKDLLNQRILDRGIAIKDYVRNHPELPGALAGTPHALNGVNYAGANPFDAVRQLSELGYRVKVVSTEQGASIDHGQKTVNVIESKADQSWGKPVKRGQLDVFAEEVSHGHPKILEELGGYNNAKDAVDFLARREIDSRSARQRVLMNQGNEAAADKININWNGNTSKTGIKDEYAIPPRGEKPGVTYEQLFKQQYAEAQKDNNAWTRLVEYGGKDPEPVTIKFYGKKKGQLRLDRDLLNRLNLGLLKGTMNFTVSPRSIAGDSRFLGSIERGPNIRMSDPEDLSILANNVNLLHAVMKALENAFPDYQLVDPVGSPVASAGDSPLGVVRSILLYRPELNVAQAHYVARIRGKDVDGTFRLSPNRVGRHPNGLVFTPRGEKPTTDSQIAALNRHFYELDPRTLVVMIDPVLRDVKPWDPDTFSPYPTLPQRFFSKSGESTLPQAESNSLVPIAADGSHRALSRIEYIKTLGLFQNVLVNTNKTFGPQVVELNVDPEYRAHDRDSSTKPRPPMIRRAILNNPDISDAALRLAARNMARTLKETVLYEVHPDRPLEAFTPGADGSISMV